MIVLVVGIPGVGKTSVIKNSLKFIKSPVNVINFGDVIFEICREKFNIKDRDDIRRVLSKSQYEEVQKLAATKIKNIGRNSNLIVDTHMFIETSFGFFSGTPEYLSDILRPSGIIVITAPPEEILERRVKDTTRLREREDLNRIRLHQDLTVIHAVVLAFKYQAVLEIVENLNGELEKASRRFAEIINNLMQ